MRKEVYLNEEEYEWVKGQSEGYIRRLIKNDMGETSGGPKRSERVVVSKKFEINEPSKKKIVKSIKVGDGEHTCKHCGYMLPYYKGACKSCGKRQKEER